MSADACPHCGAAILQRNERDGAGWVIRSRLLKVATTGKVVGTCHACGEWIDLPLSLRASRPITVRRGVKAE